MHPHANTRAHPAYIYEHAHSSHIYTDFPHVPTDEHALTFAITPPHTWTHRDTYVYTQPNVYHAYAQACTHRAPGIWNHPSSYCIYERIFVFPDHGVTVDCTADDTCKRVRQERS